MNSIKFEQMVKYFIDNGLICLKLKTSIFKMRNLKNYFFKK